MNINPKINEVGLFYNPVPVKKVRVVHHERKWVVSYISSTHNMFYDFVLSLIWQRDSIHATYAEAMLRAKEITQAGSITLLKYKREILTPVEPAIPVSTSGLSTI